MKMVSFCIVLYRFVSLCIALNRLHGHQMWANIFFKLVASNDVLQFETQRNCFEVLWHFEDDVLCFEQIFVVGLRVCDCSMKSLNETVLLLVKNALNLLLILIMTYIIFFTATFGQLIAFYFYVILWKKRVWEMLVTSGFNVTPIFSFFIAGSKTWAKPKHFDPRRPLIMLGPKPSGVFRWCCPETRCPYVTSLTEVVVPRVHWPR